MVQELAEAEVSMLSAVRLWTGATTEDITGAIGQAGATAASRDQRQVYGLLSKGRVVGGRINCTAIAGATQTLDVKIQGSPDGGTTWIDMVTFTQLTGTGAENKGLLAAYTTLLNPSGANPTGVDSFPLTRIVADLGAGTTSATFTVDAWVQTD